MLVKASSVTKLTFQGSYTITQLNNTDKPPATSYNHLETMRSTEASEE